MPSRVRKTVITRHMFGPLVWLCFSGPWRYWGQRAARLQRLACTATSWRRAMLRTISRRRRLMLVLFRGPARKSANDGRPTAARPKVRRPGLGAKSRRTSRSRRQSRCRAPLNPKAAVQGNADNRAARKTPSPPASGQAARPGSPIAARRPGTSRTGQERSANPARSCGVFVMAGSG